MLPEQHEMLVAFGLPKIYPGGIGDPENYFWATGEFHEQAFACKGLVAMKRMHYEPFNPFYSLSDVFSHYECLIHARYRGMN
eukprot:8572184-Lingulodinium_polyedra.AAC.1